MVARVERFERVPQVRELRRLGRAPPPRSSLIRAARPSAAKLPGTSWSSSSASSVAPRSRRIRASGTAASARLGSSAARPAQRRLVALLQELVDFGRDERVEEPLDHLSRLRADELGDDLPVLECLHRRNPLDSEALGQHRVCVGVELGELDLAAAGGDGLLEHRSQLPTRATPLGPEVDDDGDRDASAR